MTWNLTDVSFDESLGTGIIVHLVDSVNSMTALDVTELEIQATGVMAHWETTSGSAPDPVVTTKHVWFVPWSNVAAIRNEGVV